MKLRKPIARETVVGVADFKARCLELLDGVDTRGDRYVITKRGKPIAAVAPIPAPASRSVACFATS